VIRADQLGLAFFLSEVLLAWRKRAARAGAASHDAGTLVLVWAVILASATAAIWVARSFQPGRFELGAWSGAVLALFAAGIALRWWAIVTLGPLFTVDVAIHGDHRLVQRGPYRVLRHPSYTGLLAAFTALGLTFGSWPALAVLAVPITLALVQRIRVEEAALGRAFGAEWDAFRARTWRLVPLVW